jgi:hypothetical protein
VEKKVYFCVFVSLKFKVSKCLTIRYQQSEFCRTICEIQSGWCIWTTLVNWEIWTDCKRYVNWEILWKVKVKFQKCTLITSFWNMVKEVLLIMKPKQWLSHSQEPTSGPIKKQMNPAHILTSYFFKINFNIILPSTPTSATCSLYFRFSN